MVFSKADFLLLIAFANSVVALNPLLKEIRASFDPNDRFNDAWLNQMHSVLEKIPDSDTFSEDWDTEGDEGRLPEHDVVSMTEDMYRDLFFGPEPTKEPWFIVMVKRRRSQ